MSIFSSVLESVMQQAHMRFTIQLWHMHELGKKPKKHPHATPAVDIHVCSRMRSARWESGCCKSTNHQTPYWQNHQPSTISGTELRCYWLDSTFGWRGAHEPFALSVRTLAEDRGAKAIRGNPHFYTRVNDALQKPHLIKATSGN